MGLGECQFDNKNQQVTLKKNPHFFQIIFVFHSVFCYYKADSTMQQERMVNMLRNHFKNLLLYHMVKLMNTKLSLFLTD